MKKMINNYMCKFVLVLALMLVFMEVVKAQGDVLIRRTGIVNNSGGMIPEDLFNDSFFPTDFYAAIFDASGNPTMDILLLLISFENLPSDYDFLNGSTVMFQFQKNGRMYANLDYGLFANEQEMEFTRINGKKLYITGSCFKAYPGKEKDEGFLYIQGNKGEKVDVYLHDVSIKTQSKLLPGQSTNQWLQGYFLGNASPIAIGSTSDDTTQPFTVNFHIRGNNKLTGGATSKADKADSGLGQILGDILYLSAASIAVRPVAEIPAADATEEYKAAGLEEYRNIATKLTFDDIWPTAADGSATIRTNGMLDLPVEGDLSAPSIDLGNSKGQVEFNGGQYKFHTPRSNSMFYVSSMAICYRMLKLGGLTTIGVGGSVSAGTSSEEAGTRDFRDVVFYDGTFSTHKAELIPVSNEDATVVDVVTRGWYKDYTDLRVPYNAKIFGGTFNNCNVYRCDGSGEQGVPPVNDAGAQLCRTKNTLNPAQITNGVYNGVALESGYGSASLTPIQEGSEWNLYPYLANGCTPEPPVYKHNWVTLIPQMGMEGLLTMGGDQTVYTTTVDGTHELTNSYLFYTRLNEYTKEYAFIKLAAFEPTVGEAITLGSTNGEKEYTSITNPGDYTIDHGLYSMLSFESNKWQMISLPYNVHNIYVIETTGDDQKRADETVEQFLKRQGEADGNLAQNIVTSLCPDIFSGKGSGVNMDLIEIATKQINCPPYKLTPYNGSNEKTANFFLYEQAKYFAGKDDPYWDIRSGYGMWDLTNTDAYSEKWNIATPAPGINIEGDTETEYVKEDGTVLTDVKTIMQAGKIYSIYLPAGDEHYWDGKYLIFEGYGPQTLPGSAAHLNFYQQASVQNNQLGLQSNITFANYTTTEETFLPELTTVAATENGTYFYDFVKKPAGEMIKPGEVYGVMSASNTASATAVTYQGVIRRNDVVTENCRPTVEQFVLRAYSHNGDIVLQSFAAQNVQVVGVDGRVLYAGDMAQSQELRIPAYTGVFVVRSNDQVIKLLVE